MDFAEVSRQATLLVATSLPVAIFRAVQQFETIDRCAACKYDLSGLVLDSKCPECGSTERATRKTLVVWKRRNERWGLWASAIVVALVFVFAGEWLASELLVWSYRISGFSEVVARDVIHRRELRDGASSVLAPWSTIALVAPYCVWLGPPKWTWRALVFVYLASAAGTVMRWTIGWSP